MKTETDIQKLEQAEVLLREAGVIFVFWTAQDVKDMAEASLEDMGLKFDLDEVLELVYLTHLSCDVDDPNNLIWNAVEGAIHTLALNKLGG